MRMLSSLRLDYLGPELEPAADELQYWNIWKFFKLWTNFHLDNIFVILYTFSVLIFTPFPEEKKGRKNAKMSLKIGEAIKIYRTSKVKKF